MRRGGGSAAPSAVLASLLMLLVAGPLAITQPAHARALDAPVTFARSVNPAPLAHGTQAPVEPAPATPPAAAPAAAKPVALSGRNHRWRWSFVLWATDVRAKPSPQSRVVIRLKTLTPERTADLVLVLEGQNVGREQWLRVRLPMLPNNSTGWVSREALSGYETRRGQKRRPTPTGQFYVRNELRGFDSAVHGRVRR